jgi:hypothetical protein
MRCVTLYLCVIDEPKKDQYIKLFVTEKDACNFLAQYHEFHVKSKVKCYTIHGAEVAKLLAKYKK